MRAALDQQPSDEKGTVELILVDMGSLTSVRGFAEEAHRRYDRLDLLINNAGVAFPPQPLSADGYETHFAVNHLSHFFLTTLLFDLLKKSPAARVVNVSSLAHKRSQMNFETIVAESGYAWGRYGQSKLANLLFTYELSRRLEAAHISNVLSAAAHPGVTYTPIADKMVESIFPKFIHGMLKRVISWLPLQSSAMGALPTLYAATAEDVRNGEYFGPARFAGHFGHPVRETSQPQSHSKEEAQQLWQLGEELTKLSFHVS
ncbi:hypothetical protein Poli38472_005415 [Pythium oligandrum]|uniref:Uncharacterized protein n=1 Tax=Pythium oligandrum TaxID=41045 RepID=A0A8K1CGA1_PYTOL|nr:hypothetical protein Poli38472_005415 [Pythium oligandrum]|eukprot:TMW62797.1 hypothetical protein Poli38472_005415 [Pythium oligandrum]